MDSIILHFKNVEKSAIDLAVGKMGIEDGAFQNDGELYFYWGECSKRELHSEYELEEEVKLFQLLNGEPTCSFVLSSRHGEHAREALRFTVELLQQFSDCIVDDDCGNFWNYNELLSHYQSSDEATIYSIRVEQ